MGGTQGPPPNPPLVTALQFDKVFKLNSNSNCLKNHNAKDCGIHSGISKDIILEQVFRCFDLTRFCLLKISLIMAIGKAFQNN